MSDPYLGEIRMVGFKFAPYGWALCQGQQVAIAQNQALYALLGTTFGGNGQTNFNLPDLRSRSPVGTGQGLGLSSIEPGEMGGEESATMTVNQMPMHTHVAQSSGGGSGTAAIAIPVNATSNDTVSTPATNTVLAVGTVSGHTVPLYSTAAPTTTLAPFNAPVTGNAPSVQISPTGASQPTPLRNPYLGLTCIISLQGLYPTQG